MDIYYTQNKIIPTINDYNKMMEYKSGMFFFTILDLLDLKRIVIDFAYN